MNARITPPVADIDESEIDLSISDLEDMSTSELEELESAPTLHPNSTPSHIAAMEMGSENADDEAVTQTLVDLHAEGRKRNVFIVIAAGILAVFIVLFVLVRSGGNDDGIENDFVAVTATEESDTVDPAPAEEMMALADMEIVEDITDDTEEPATVPTATPAAEEALMPESDEALAPVMEITEQEAGETASGYDAEKCAAPATDREWMECANAAYAELQLENKRLEAHIAELEGRPSIGSSTSTMTLVLAGIAWVLLFTFLIGRHEYTKRKIFAKTAP